MVDGCVEEILLSGESSATSAGAVMVVEHQNALARPSEEARADESTHARTDDDDVIGIAKVASFYGKHHGSEITTAAQ
jgi:hypothetical protein